VVLSREVVLGGQPVDAAWLAYTYLVGLAALLFGRWAFLRLRPAFADVI
jgi:ABC-type polysaccharide/polyol phosphate export permease